jgi:hypothetical protein
MRHAITQRQQPGISPEFKRVAIPVVLSVYQWELVASALGSGGYTPVRAEQLMALSAGTLFVTSKRLLFSGESRNTTITLTKIVDGHVYSDCVRIEKSSGKPDLFSMNTAQARFVLSLVGFLKEQ